MRYLIAILLILGLLAACSGPPPEEAYEQRPVIEYPPAPPPPAMAPPVYRGEDVPAYADPEYFNPDDLPPTAAGRPRSIERDLIVPTEPSGPSAPEQSAIPDVPTFDDVSSQLSAAEFGYNIPESINISEIATVRMVINPSSGEAEITQSLGGEATFVGNILITKIVEARLTSKHFEITEVTAMRQVVDANLDTVWIWELKPKSPGENKEVKISVNAIITIGDDRAERTLEVYEQSINVDITREQRIKGWLSENWKWAWSALLIPLVAFLWRRRKKKPEDAGDPTP